MIHRSAITRWARNNGKPRPVGRLSLLPFRCISNRKAGYPHSFLLQVTSPIDTRSIQTREPASIPGGIRWWVFLSNNPYPDRKERDQDLLVYTSEPLSAALEVTGHPVATVYLSSTTPDTTSSCTWKMSRQKETCIT